MHFTGSSRSRLRIKLDCQRKFNVGYFLFALDIISVIRCHNEDRTFATGSFLVVGLAPVLGIAIPPSRIFHREVDVDSDAGQSDVMDQDSRVVTDPDSELFEVWETSPQKDRVFSEEEFHLSSLHHLRRHGSYEEQRSALARFCRYVPEDGNPDDEYFLSNQQPSPGEPGLHHRCHRCKTISCLRRGGHDGTVRAVYVVWINSGGSTRRGSPADYRWHRHHKPYTFRIRSAISKEQESNCFRCMFPIPPNLARRWDETLSNSSRSSMAPGLLPESSMNCPTSARRLRE